MWPLISAAHQHPLLVAWCGRLHQAVSVSRVGSQFASYHATATLLHTGDSSFSVARRRRRQKPVLNEGWRDPVHGKVQENQIPLIQRTDQRAAGNQRVSSELRKLCLEDSPKERDRQVMQRSTLDPMTESYEVVFGISPCLLALTQGRRKARRLFVKNGESSHRTSVLKVCEEAFRRGVHIQRVSKKELDRMSSGRLHQGVCLQASPLSYLTDHTESAPNRKENNTPLWLVLERVQDPMNLGAILRTAYFLGVDRVASSLHHSCPLSPVVSKASSGAMEVLEVYGYEKLKDMLKLKMAQGWQVVGTVAAEAGEVLIPITRCSEFRMTKPTLLLIGGEGEGLSQELLALCQTLLTIPAGRDLFTGMESLNVSVATGILVHFLLLSRGLNR